MTIQLPPTPPPGPFDHSSAGLPTPGSGATTVHVRRAHSESLDSLSAGGWRDTPPSEWNHELPHLGLPPGGRLPLPPAPHGDTDPATQQQLIGKFEALLKDGGALRDQRTEDSSEHEDHKNGGGNDNPAAQFSIEDVLQLLVREGSDGFKMAAAQTQLATTEKVQFLTGEESDIRSAGGDRKIGSILAGVGSIAQGLASMASAGLSGAGVRAGNAAVTEANTQATTAGQTLSAQTTAQIFAEKSAGMSGWSQAAGGFGAATQGGMNIGQGTKESAATQRDADKAAAEKGAAEEDSLHDNAQSMKQQYLSVMQEYVEKRKSMEQSHDETMKALVRA